MASSVKTELFHRTGTSPTTARSGNRIPSAASSSPTTSPSTAGSPSTRWTGSTAHYDRTGKIGNIDLRDGVGTAPSSWSRQQPHHERPAVLDPRPARAHLRRGRPLPTLTPNYGFCLGRDASGHLYAFVSAEGGRLVQAVQSSGTSSAGIASARKARAFDIGSQTEGCVVDDTTGALYVGEEDVGIWRYAVDPATGQRSTAAARRTPHGRRKG